MATKRELTSQYGREDDGTFFMVCPHCDPEQKFESIEEWKSHMAKQHGGYTSSEVASGLGEALPRKGGDDLPRSDAASPPPKPKRLSQRARELNDKVNRCVSLVIKHLISGVTEEERQELEQLRTAVTEAFVGIEFDFEEKLFSLTGKWAVLVVLVLLYTLPSLPSMKEATAKARDKAMNKLGGEK